MKKFISGIAICSLFVLAGQGCLGGGGSTATLEPVELTIWRVFDEDDTFDTIVSNYRALHQNVKINYRELRFEEYEDELIRAFAEGRGPDIFSVHNTKMGEFKSLMDPMPESVTITQTEARGTVRQEFVTTSVQKKMPTQRDIKTDYVEQVASDVILNYQPDPDFDPQERIFGLPMSFDTLALYYNKDLLDAAGIASPPETWDQFQEAVVALTSYDNEGEISASGAAIGLGENVDRSADILSLLMLQNGTQMTDERGRVAFNVAPEGFDRDATPPGLQASIFYTDFANPTKQVYTWNDEYESSFEAFTNGETAMFFGYSYHNPLIKTVAPKLNYSIASVPQIAGGKEVNMANYWIETVSKSSAYSDWAWDFLVHAASEEQVVHYLNEAQKPTALRNLLSAQLDDEFLGVFASQALTAESWYHGIDADAAEEALRELMTGILGTIEDQQDIVDTAARKVSQTY